MDKAVSEQQQEVPPGQSCHSEAPGEHSAVALETHSLHTLLVLRCGVVALLICAFGSVLIQPLCRLVSSQWVVLQRITPGVAQCSLLSTPQIHAGRVACCLHLLRRRESTCGRSEVCTGRAWPSASASTTRSCTCARSTCTHPVGRRSCTRRSTPPTRPPPATATTPSPSSVTLTQPHVAWDFAFFSQNLVKR